MSVTVANKPVWNPTAAATLLDFTKIIDIELLDDVVTLVFKTAGDNRLKAKELLNQLRSKPDAWTRAIAMIELSNQILTKYFALQIIEDTVQTRWHALPKQKIKELRTYIFVLIAHCASEAALASRNRILVSKLNSIICEFLARDWFNTWPIFASEMVTASKECDSYSLNNMKIVKMYCNIIFCPINCEREEMKYRILQNKLYGEFMLLIGVTEFILHSTSPSDIELCTITLDTMLMLLTCCLGCGNLDLLFEKDLVILLTRIHFTNPIYRNAALQCLACFANRGGQYQDHSTEIYLRVISMLDEVLPIEQVAGYPDEPEEGKLFVRNLAIFLTSFLRKHLDKFMANKTLRLSMVIGFNYVVAITTVKDHRVLIVCVEFWSRMCGELVAMSEREVKMDEALAKTLHDNILRRLADIMIRQMLKPDEVLAAESHRATDKSTSDENRLNHPLRRAMREVLINLTRLNHVCLYKALMDILVGQINGSEWSPDILRALCWSIGSVSGAIDEERENVLARRVMYLLIETCKRHEGNVDPDERAVLATSTCYVIGQFMRVFVTYPEMVKKIVNVLVHFMIMKNNTVQTIACNTFVRIARTTPRVFLGVPEGETHKFVDTIFLKVPYLARALLDHKENIVTFYQALAYMIKEEKDTAIQEELLRKFMSIPNAKLNKILDSGETDSNVFATQTNTILLIMKTNHQVCMTLGSPYMLHFLILYPKLLKIYTKTSLNINSIRVGTEAQNAIVETMREIKIEILNLFGDFVVDHTDQEMFHQTFIPSILNTVLNDYKFASFREHQVLSTMTAFIVTLKSKMLFDTKQIITSVFECTSDLIFRNAETYTKNHVLASRFYQLITAINDYCSPVWFLIEANELKKVLNTIFLTMKQREREVAEMGMLLLFHFLMSIDCVSSQVMGFYRTSFTSIVETVLEVAVRPDNMRDLSKYMLIIAHMCSMVHVGSVNVPRTASMNPVNNHTKVLDYLVVQLRASFPRLDKGSISMAVKGLFNLNGDLNSFKEYLRGFVVQIRKAMGMVETFVIVEYTLATMEAQRNKLRISKTMPWRANASMIH